MADLASTRVFGTLVVAHRATVEGGQVWHSNNHGSGSGLDADLLDGHDSTYFATAADLNSHLHDDRYLQLTGGSVSGALSVSGDLTLGGSRVKSTAPINFLNGSAAQAINTNELLVSSNYSHRSLVPNNGMYVAGNVKSGGTFHGVGSGLTGVNAASVGGKSISTIESDYAAADAATLASANGYTDTSIAALVDSSPGTLDTLNELAAALGDDPNFATTITTQIGTKLDATAYTAADVLAKLKTVDGAGSLLDADTLDGNHASAFATAAHAHPVADITGLSDAATTTVATIRAGTTAANVGLGSVRNVASYSQTEADAAFAPITHGHSVADITGLSDAATTTVAAIRSGTTAANVGLGNVRNVDAYAKTEFTDADTANAPMVRNASGDVWCRLFRSSYSSTNANIAAIYTTQTIGGDYMRPSTPAQVKAALNISASDVSGLSNAATTTVATIRAGTTAANVGLSKLSQNTNGLRITQNGSVDIGNRNTSWTHYSSSTGSHYFYGTLTCAGNITAYSDRRVKENLEIIPDALERVSSITGYTYDRIDEEAPRQTGVVAQDVQAVLPEAVVEDPETGHLHVAYGNLVGLLIEAIKEEKSHREVLESRIAVLESGGVR